MFQKFYSSTKEHVSSITDGAMAPAAMMNDLAYSLLLAQSDNIHMYYFTRINTHRPLGKKKGSQEIFQILLKKCLT